MQFDLEDAMSLSIESKYFKEPMCYEYNGKMIPRVTAVLSRMIEEPGVAQWANSLGYKHLSYGKELDKICAIGTLVHEQINSFLKGNSIEQHMASFGFLSFLEWYKQVSQLGIEVLGLEESLITPQYGGTYDALLKINNKVWLIDFKTSNKVGFKYFIQLAAYRRLLKEVKNIEIDGCLILQLSKYHPTFLEYVADLHFEPHAEYMRVADNAFMSLLYAFYHVCYMEGRFKDEWPLNPKILSKR